MVLSFKRNCTKAYNNNSNKIIMKNMSDINSFLSFNKNPPCFEIMYYNDYKKLQNSEKDDKFQICSPNINKNDTKPDTKTLTLNKLTDEMTKFISYSEANSYIHIVLVKHLSKGKPKIISHLLGEIVNNECTIHYICKCTKINKSCDLKRIGSLMIYYMAFLAKKNNCQILKLISDKSGGDKLKKYYESLGFVEENNRALRRVWSKRDTVNNLELNTDGTPMILSLLSFKEFEF